MTRTNSFIDLNKSIKSYNRSNSLLNLSLTPDTSLFLT
jgi:hypothetical protein